MSAVLRYFIGRVVLTIPVLLGVAKEHCGGKVVSLLEGGYNVTALADCVALHLSVLNAE